MVILGVASNPSTLECETEFTLRIASLCSGKNLLSCMFVFFFSDADRKQVNPPFCCCCFSFFLSTFFFFGSGFCHTLT